MARRYDSRTTIFSPEGRLYQVEYAMEAISNAGAAIGMLCTDGVVLVAEKKITSKVEQQDSTTQQQSSMEAVCTAMALIACIIALRTLQEHCCSRFLLRHRPGSKVCVAWLLLFVLQLLDTKAVGVRREKMYKLDDHLACAVAGITGGWGVVCCLG